MPLLASASTEVSVSEPMPIWEKLNMKSRQRVIDLLVELAIKQITQQVTNYHEKEQKDGLQPEQDSK